MKVPKIEIISISESEEEDERYLKIFYQNSTKFIEVPLNNDDGTLLLLDVKAMEPDIFALNLIKSGSEKLYKPKNGCFKEPKEKWSGFKVFVVLNPTSEVLKANSLISDSIFNSKPDTNGLQSPSGTCEYKIKKKKTSIPIIESSPSISLSFTDSENTDSSETVVSKNADITDADLCDAFNVTNFDELKELLCDGNQMFYECFGLNIHIWKKTIISDPNVQIIKAIFYAFYSYIYLSVLDPSLPSFCEICDRALTLRHLVGKWHVRKYQSLFNADPPEISVILNPKNFVHFFPPNALMDITKKSFDTFLNNFYPEKRFNDLKGYLLQGVTEAQLNMPFEDPLFIEKLLFLRENFKNHPKLKDIFPMLSSCDYCRKSFRNMHDYITHILNKQHLTSSLTQDELDKLFYAASFICYSDAHGYYYANNSTENRKRNHHHLATTEKPSKRHKKFSDS